MVKSHNDAIWDSLTKSLLIHCCDRKAGNWGGSPRSWCHLLMTHQLGNGPNPWKNSIDSKISYEQVWFEIKNAWTFLKNWISKCPERSIQETFHNISTDANALVWKSATSTRSSELRSPYCDSMGIKSAEKNRKDGKFTCQIRRYYRHVKYRQLEENSQDMLPEFVADCFVNPVSVQGEAFSLGSLVTANDVTQLWQLLLLASWTNRSARIESNVHKWRTRVM